MGGVLFVKYAVDNDLLPPATRCAIGLIFGLVLVLIGEFLRRKTVARSTYVPAAITAAGLVVAFGSIYAAYEFYGLINSTAAFAGLAVLALGAFALSMVEGPLIAALGLVGSYATPAIIPSPDASAATFFPYLFIILAACFAILRRRPWWWLGAAAIIGAFGWALLWIWSGFYEPADLIPIGIFALAMSALPAVVIARQEASPSIVWVMSGAIVATFLILIALCVRSGHSETALLFLLAAAIGAVATAFRRGPFDVLAPLAALLSLLALTAWQEGGFSVPAYDEFGSYVMVLGPEAGRFLRWMAIFAGLFIAASYVGIWIKSKPAAWGWLGLGTVLAYGFVAYGRAPDALSNQTWALIAGGLALAYLIGILPGRRRADEPQFNLALGLCAIAATVLAGFALFKSLESVKLTLAWAVLVPVLGLLALRLPVRLLGPIASTVGIVVTLRLLATRELWFDASNLWLGPHFILYAYGVPALLFWLSSWLFARAAHPRTAIALEGAALGLAIALISLELRVLIAGDVKSDEPTLVEVAAHALAWLGAAIGLMHRQKAYTSPVALWGSRILILAASFILIVGALGSLNPVLTELPVTGGLVFNALILAYLLPALMLAIIAKDLDHIGWGKARPFFGGFALLLALVYLTLQTKRYFQGPVLVLDTLNDAENYAYSAVWLAFALALLVAGIWRNWRALRYAGLIVTALVVLKVFLLDMSGTFRPLSYCFAVGPGFVPRLHRLSLCPIRQTPRSGEI